MLYKICNLNILTQSTKYNDNKYSMITPNTVSILDSRIPKLGRYQIVKEVEDFIIANKVGVLRLN